MMRFAKGLSLDTSPSARQLLVATSLTAFVRAAGSMVFLVMVMPTAPPCCLRSGAQNLEIYECDGIFSLAARRGDYLQNKLREIEQHPLVGEVRGKGLIGAIELVADRESGKPFRRQGCRLLCAVSVSGNGLISRCVAGASLALCPPLVITESEIDEMISALNFSGRNTGPCYENRIS